MLLAQHCCIGVLISVLFIFRYFVPWEEGWRGEGFEFISALLKVI